MTRGDNGQEILEKAADNSTDLLLINSPLFETPLGQDEDSLPPLGLGYIATAVRNSGFNVSLLDAASNDCGSAGVIEAIISSKPRVVGINVFSTNLPLVEQIVTAPFEAQILIGGPAVRALTDIVLSWETPNPITVIEGEAEHALPAFLRGSLIGQPWRQQEKRKVIQITPRHSLHPNVIDLPLDRKFFNNEPIEDTYWNVKEAHIISSRGCCHDCAFCGAARSVSSTPIRFRTESDIRTELAHIRQKFPNTSSIRVIDDLFIRNSQSIEQACKLFHRSGFSWRAMAHVNGFRDVSKKLYNNMKKSGCLELFIGIESGNLERRKLIGKPREVESSIKMISNLFRAGIAVKAYFIFGFPGETKREMDDTFAVASTMANEAIQLGAHFRTSVFKFRPYHGTRIYNELVSSGVNLGKIKADLQLTAIKGHRQFNFTGENFSNVALDTLNDFIRLTQEL